MATAAHGPHGRGRPNLSSIEYSLAEASGISRSYLCLILSGKRTPSLPVARKLAQSMDISLDDLYKRLEEKQLVAA
jgi:transcriptional regulator with XRE-family HTH domain